MHRHSTHTLDCYPVLNQAHSRKDFHGQETRKLQIQTHRPGVIVSVWLDLSVVETKIDADILFETHRAVTAKAIHKAMHHEPTIDWLLANQNSIKHCFHEMALEGTL